MNEYFKKKFECWASNENDMVGVCNGEWMVYSLGDETLTTLGYSCGLSQLYETLRNGGLYVFQSTTSGYKEVIFLSFIMYFAFLSLSLL